MGKLKWPTKKGHSFTIQLSPWRIEIQWNPDQSRTLGFPNLPITRSNRFLYNFSRQLELPITRTVFYFPWRFELSGVDCTDHTRHVFCYLPFLFFKYSAFCLWIKVKIYIKKDVFLLKFEHLLIITQYPAN